MLRHLRWVFDPDGLIISPTLSRTAPLATVTHNTIYSSTSNSGASNFLNFDAKTNETKFYGVVVPKLLLLNSNDLSSFMNSIPNSCEDWELTPWFSDLEEKGLLEGVEFQLFCNLVNRHLFVLSHNVYTKINLAILECSNMNSIVDWIFDRNRTLMNNFEVVNPFA